MELLKLRFGESHMHYCEVMLKVGPSFIHRRSLNASPWFNVSVAVQDMADSRRINSHIREEESKLSEEEQPPLALSAIVLSSEFWPTLKEEKLELPAAMCHAMEAYTRRYEKLKVNRPAV